MSCEYEYEFDSDLYWLVGTVEEDAIGEVKVLRDFQVVIRLYASDIDITKVISEGDLELLKSQFWEAYESDPSLVP